MSIYDYKKNTLQYTIRNTIFDLKLRGNITIIDGASASGKTLLFNSILNIKRLDKEIAKVDASNIYLITYGHAESFDDKECLVIIDCGELVLTDKLCRKITQCNKARFLIFTRGSHNLYCSPNHFGEFVKDSNNTITIDYMFNEPGWC